MLQFTLFFVPQLKNTIHIKLYISFQSNDYFGGGGEGDFI